MTDTATKSALGWGIFDRLTTYAAGRFKHGWFCATCGRSYFHNGKPRRTYLALLDHIVLDHRRLPLRFSHGYWRAYPAATPPGIYTSGNSTWSWTTNTAAQFNVGTSTYTVALKWPQ